MPFGITKDNVQKFLQYVNRYAYFQKGRQWIEVDGEKYPVEGVMKFLHLSGLID